MKTCGKCGLQSGDFAKFCQDCGSPLSMECANCGTELPTDAEFCFECGTSQTIVVFPDKELEDAVREVLEKPEVPLTRQDLKKLVNLKLSGTIRGGMTKD